MTENNGTWATSKISVGVGVGVSVGVVVAVAVVFVESTKIEQPQKISFYNQYFIRYGCIKQ